MEARDGLSRRALFGAGLGHLVDAGLDLHRGLDLERDDGTRAHRRPRPAASPPFGGWGEGDVAGLGARLEAVAAGLLEACGVRPGMRVLAAAAGDGVLGRTAARRGARVTAIEADEERVARGRAACEHDLLGVDWAVGSVAQMPVDESAYDAVISLFGASHADDPRAAAAELVRVARPGAAIALSAWTGFMADLLRVVGPHAARSQRWARFETAYLHFFGFPELDVRESAVEWRFAGIAEAVEELAAPAAADGAEQRVRDALPRLLDRYGDSQTDGLVIRASYATVFARRPG